MAHNDINEPHTQFRSDDKTPNPILVPAWDKVALADLGDKAMAFIPDAAAISDDYGRLEEPMQGGRLVQPQRTGFFARFHKDN